MVESAQAAATLAPGSIVIDETSSRLIESHFTVTRHANGLLLLGGAMDSADETRPLLGMPTQCFGRDRELNILESAFADCLENNTATVVMVSAPPGVGKSRLRHEFLRRLIGRHSEVLVLTGRGDPMSAGSSYGLLAQALRRLFGISDGEEAAVRQDKIRQRVSQSIADSEAARVAEFLSARSAVRRFPIACSCTRRGRTRA